VTGEGAGLKLQPVRGDGRTPIKSITNQLTDQTHLKVQRGNRFTTCTLLLIKKNLFLSRHADRFVYNIQNIFLFIMSLFHVDVFNIMIKTEKNLMKSNDFD